MTAKTLTIVCPHCGFDSEDEELCRACGELLGDTPGMSVPLTKILGTWLRRIKTKPLEHDDEMYVDLTEEATMSPLPGSSWALHHDD